MKVMPLNFFPETYNYNCIEKFIYFMGTSLTKLKLFFPKVSIMNTFFFQLCSISYMRTVLLKHQSSSCVLCFCCCHLQNGVYGVHTSGDQKDGCQMVLKYN